LAAGVAQPLLFQLPLQDEQEEAEVEAETIERQEHLGKEMQAVLVSITLAVASLPAAAVAGLRQREQMQQQMCQGQEAMDT
jgi:hypothetical protein